MPALIKLISTDAVDREIPLDAFPLRLGRTGKADICIDDRWVSRVHCEIDLEDQVLVIRDLGSKHGTYVNGRSVRRAELRAGDEVSLGLTRFVIRCEAGPSAGGRRPVPARAAGADGHRFPVGVRDI